MTTTAEQITPHSLNVPTQTPTGGQYWAMIFFNRRDGGYVIVHNTAAYDKRGYRKGRKSATDITTLALLAAGLVNGWQDAAEAAGWTSREVDGELVWYAPAAATAAYVAPVAAPIAAKAVKAARKGRPTTLDLARAQFDRQLAERPTGIHRNPDAQAGRQWEAYQDGRLLGGADSNFGAQAILDGVTYDELSRRNTQGMDAPAADLVVTAVVEDVVVHELVYAPAAEEASVSDFQNTLIGRLARAVASTETTAAGAEIGAWVAPVADVADAAEVASDVFDAEAHAMKPETYEREVVAVEQAGTGEFARAYVAEAVDADPPVTIEEAELIGAWHLAAQEYGGYSVGESEAYAALADYRRDHGIPLCADGGCVYQGRALECPRCAAEYPDGILSPEEMDAHSDALPRPLPVCPCGVTYTTHAIPGCECAAAEAAARATCVLTPAEIEMLTACDEDGPIFPSAPSTSEPVPCSCDQCQCPNCGQRIPEGAPFTGDERHPYCPTCANLPFTPGPAETADALAEIEAAAGVVADEPPPSELELQFAETTRRLVEWQDTVANGGDWVTARRAHIDAMLEVERFAGLKAWPAVVGHAA